MMMGGINRVRRKWIEEREEDERGNGGRGGRK